MISEKPLKKITLMDLNLNIGNTECSLLLVLGSAWSISNLTFEKQIMYDCITAKWTEKRIGELRKFSNARVDTLGCIKIPFREKKLEYRKG